MRRTILLLAVLLAAAGCGTKGPLYFRDSPPPGVKPPRTEPPYKPVPYPEATREESGQEANKK
jgi:predicted small lipoprotein YifL